MSGGVVHHVLAAGLLSVGATETLHPPHRRRWTYRIADDEEFRPRRRLTGWIRRGRIRRARLGRATRERLERTDEAPAVDEREAARLGRVDACFLQGDAGVSIDRRPLSTVVHRERWHKRLGRARTYVWGAPAAARPVARVSLSRPAPRGRAAGSASRAFEGPSVRHLEMREERASGYRHGRRSLRMSMVVDGVGGRRSSAGGSLHPVTKRTASQGRYRPSI
jgi:hypothetical protein